MQRKEDIVMIEKELEKLREGLNKDALKLIKNNNGDEYKKLLAKSMEIDNIIVNYIKELYNSI